jgi:ribosome-binding protein aMBF1 (putative translation factor)
MSQPYDNQDWTPVVLRKRTSLHKGPVKINGPLSVRTNPFDKSKLGDSSIATLHRQTGQNLAPTKFRALDGDDPEEMKKAIVKVSRSLGSKIATARASLETPMTRRDLAVKCSVKESLITDFETGKALFDISLLQKINRALGTSFSKKDNQ